MKRFIYRKFAYIIEKVDEQRFQAHLWSPKGVKLVVLTTRWTETDAISSVQEEIDLLYANCHTSTK